MSTMDTNGSAPQHSHPHNNTVSCNEKFWVDQVTSPPRGGRTRGGEGQGVGKDKGWGVQKSNESVGRFGSIQKRNNGAEDFGKFGRRNGGGGIACVDR